MQTTWTSTDVYWRNCKKCGFERIVDMSDQSDWVEVQP